MLFCYTKSTIIKAIKMIAINSKMKRKKGNPSKLMIEKFIEKLQKNNTYKIKSSWVNYAET